MGFAVSVLGYGSNLREQSTGAVYGSSLRQSTEAVYGSSLREQSTGADGAPIYNSCADYASIKTCGGVNCCTHGKAGSVRRRSWAGDAKENCYLSCGYCTTTTTTTTSTTVTTTTTTTTSSTTTQACADGSPIYNSCADYASIKTCGGVNCCSHGKSGSVRRRSWAGDAKENCYLSCGYCG